MGYTQNYLIQNSFIMEYTILESVIMILLWIAAIYGITQIITEASIFSTVRNYFASRTGFMSHLGTLLNCFLCASVWVSAGVSMVLYSPCTQMYPELNSHIFAIFFDAMIGSAFAWFLYVLENRIS